MTPQERASVKNEAHPGHLWGTFLLFLQGGYNRNFIFDSISLTYD